MNSVGINLTVAQAVHYRVIVVFGNDCDFSNYYELDLADDKNESEDVEHVFLSDTLRLTLNSDGSTSEEVGDFSGYRDAKSKFKTLEKSSIRPLKTSTIPSIEGPEIVFWFNGEKRLVFEFTTNQSIDINPMLKKSFVRYLGKWTSLSFEGSMGECYLHSINTFNKVAREKDGTSGFFFRPMALRRIIFVSK
nr:P20 [Carrot closterovirus 2]